MTNGGCSRPMLTRTENIGSSVENWLVQFEHALAASDDAALKALFHDESYWRDVLALTWSIRTVSGADNIVAQLKACGARAQPSGFAIASRRCPPRRVSRAGTEATEAIFQFETQEGRGSGVVRLTADARDRATLKAWT